MAVGIIYCMTSMLRMLYFAAYRLVKEMALARPDERSERF